MAAQAGGMNARLRSLFEPLNIAAYLAWVAIAVGLFNGTGNNTGLVSDGLLVPLALGLHGLYLLCFLGCQWLPGSAHRQLLLVMAQLVLGLLVTALVRYSAAPILLVVAASQLALLCRLPWLLVLLGAVNLGLYWVIAAVWQVRDPWLMTMSYTSFQLFAGLMSWYAFSAGRTRDELVQVNADLLATRSLLAESARDHERLRLSRELHDVTGHKLTALKLNLSALERDPRWQGEPAIALCRQLADELLADIRGVVQQMRLHDGMDLRAAIGSIAAPFPRPRVHLQLDEAARVGDIVQAEAVLRTVQESLTNSARHSQAENIWIVLRREGARVAIDIRDDGRSAGAITLGNGLSGMRERLEALGGALQVERNGAGGVQLLAWLPVPA